MKPYYYKLPLVEPSKDSCWAVCDYNGKYMFHFDADIPQHIESQIIYGINQGIPAEKNNFRINPNREYVIQYQVSKNNWVDCIIIGCIFNLTGISRKVMSSREAVKIQDNLLFWLLSKLNKN